ncbi:MAG: hypothetical protein WA734_05620, partial [Candidatus Acidiferrales bacterium]
MIALPVRRSPTGDVRPIDVKHGAGSWLILLYLLSRLVAAPSLPAQQTQPDSYAGFEGQNVSQVEVAAGNGVDLQAMRN